ncbi:divergent PAP2 family protein [Candidatus Saccharibacteria bacterium]|nr:divergent PAP2 family protein [Candidatus Saccharibacteria bacterium]
MISPYLLAGLLAWIVAQGAKYIINSIQTKSFRQFRQLYLSGSMPSAHSATVIAVTTVIGLVDGIDSGLFGLAVLLSSIVMYDAMMVRHSAGEQGTTLNLLLTALKSEIKPSRVTKGHTPIEVVAGALVGFVIGLVVFFATK